MLRNTLTRLTCLAPCLGDFFPCPGTSRWRWTPTPGLPLGRAQVQTKAVEAGQVGRGDASLGVDQRTRERHEAKGQGDAGQRDGHRGSARRGVHCVSAQTHNVQGRVQHKYMCVLRNSS